MMQGKIHEVVKLKPHQILNYLEEIIGVTYYEEKRKNAETLIEKKKIKLKEIEASIKEEL